MNRIGTSPVGFADTRNTRAVHAALESALIERLRQRDRKCPWEPFWGRCCVLEWSFVGSLTLSGIAMILEQTFGFPHPSLHQSTMHTYLFMSLHALTGSLVNPFMGFSNDHHTPQSVHCQLLHTRATRAYRLCIVYYESPKTNRQRAGACCRRAKTRGRVDNEV